MAANIQLSYCKQTKQPVLHSTNNVASANKTTCPTLNQQCGWCKQNNLSYTQPTLWLVQTKQSVLHSTNTVASNSISHKKKIQFLRIFIKK